MLLCLQRRDQRRGKTLSRLDHLVKRLAKIFQSAAKITSEDGSCQALTHYLVRGQQDQLEALMHCPALLLLPGGCLQGEQKALVKLWYFDEGLGID